MILTNYNTDESPLYYPVELANAGIIPRKSINRYCNEMPQEYVVKDHRIKIYKSNTVARMKVYLVNENGMKYILCKTRRSIAEELLLQFNIQIENKFNNEEAKWISAIKESFHGTEIKEQYRVGKYKLDAYFPKYNIVLEIDEPSHKFYNFKKELERVITINFLLKNPTIIRVDLSRDISIFKIINKIHLAILANKN